MALTATQIQELINSNLASGTSIPAYKHREVETELLNFINSIAIKQPKNIGWFSGLDVGGSSGELLVSGDVVTANVEDSGNNSKVTVNISNAMADMNYVVKLSVESESSDLYSDNDISAPIFKKISTTQFQVGLREFASGVGQNLKIHIEVTQL